MNRADEFLRLYNELTNVLARLTNEAVQTPYQKLLDLASQRNSTVRRLRDRLRIYGYLRNAIVHYSEYPPEIVAEPAMATVRRLKEVLDELQSPERLVPRFRRIVRCFAPTDPLLSALDLMRQEDFSQVIVVRDGEMCLLSAEGIARWLEDEAADRSVNIAGARVLDALSREIPDAFTVMSANHTLDDAREAFSGAIDSGHPRLFAVIITPGGGRRETPIGIVTPWDLLQS